MITSRAVLLSLPRVVLLIPLLLLVLILFLLLENVSHFLVNPVGVLVELLQTSPLLVFIKYYGKLVILQRVLPERVLPLRQPFRGGRKKRVQAEPKSQRLYLKIFSTRGVMILVSRGQEVSSAGLVLTSMR